jgi:hypothetical protein
MESGKALLRLKANGKNHLYIGHTWFMAEVDEAVDNTDWTRYAQRIALAVYGTLTVLGVLEATSFDEPSLQVHIVLITVISTSVAIVLAHAWATVMSNRLVFAEELTSASLVEELRFAAAFLIPTVIAVVVFTIAAAFLPVDSCLVSAELALVVLLFILGVWGARRGGAAWPRAILIGVIDVGVGVLIVLIKELHTLFTH